MSWRGRALMSGIAKTARVQVALAGLHLLLDLFGVTVPVLYGVTVALALGMLASAGVLACWNLPLLLGELRDRSLERGTERIYRELDLERQRRQEPRVPGIEINVTFAPAAEGVPWAGRPAMGRFRDTAAVSTVSRMRLEEEWAVSTGRAVRGSMGELRYIGPPPVYTPPSGIRIQHPGND